MRDRSPAGAGTLTGVATAAKSSGTVTVDVGGYTVTALANRDVTFAAGDLVIITKVGSQWHVLTRYGTAAITDPPISEPAPNPKPPTTTGTLVVAPVETRSYRTSFGWRTDNTDVYQGEYGGNGNHTGAVFYGTKLRSLTGATVTDAKVRVRRVPGGMYAAQTTTIRLMTNVTRPAGAPTLTSTTTGPSLAVGATNDAFDVPNSWVQEMVNGTAGGLAFFDADGSPYVRFAGRGSWSPAFTLTVDWQRG